MTNKIKYDLSPQGIGELIQTMARLYYRRDPFSQIGNKGDTGK